MAGVIVVGITTCHRDLVRQVHSCPPSFTDLRCSTPSCPKSWLCADFVEMRITFNLMLTGKKPIMPGGRGRVPVLRSRTTSYALARLAVSLCSTIFPPPNVRAFETPAAPAHAFRCAMRPLSRPHRLASCSCADMARQLGVLLFIALGARHHGHHRPVWRVSSRHRRTRSSSCAESKLGCHSPLDSAR